MNTREFSGMFTIFSFLKKSSFQANAYAAFIAISLILSPVSHSSPVSLTATDTGTDSSFNTLGHWSSGLAPSAGNDYTVDSGYYLRTPSAGGSYSFAGDSLTFSGGAILVYKGVTTGTITIPNLTLTGNSGIWNANAGSLAKISANITLGSGSYGLMQMAYDGNSSNNSGIDFLSSSSISGSGALWLRNNMSNLSWTYGITIECSNTYTGGTKIYNYVNVIATSDHAFGTGDVTFSDSTSILTLQSGATNDYISSTGKLILSSSSNALAAGAINLNFSGTDILGGITMNGTSLSAGIYSASDLNTLYNSLYGTSSSVFTGTGYLQVIPEPSTYGLLIAGITSLALISQRKRLFIM